MSLKRARESKGATRGAERSHPMTEEPEDDDEEGKQERASTTSEQVTEVVVSPDLKGTSDSKSKPLPVNATEAEQDPPSRQNTHSFWLTRSGWQQLLPVIIVGILGVLLLLLWEARNAPGDTVLKDIIGLVQAISWPIFGVIALFLLYKPISSFLVSLGGQNVQTVKFTVLQLFAVEYSKASNFTPTWSFPGLDLRFAPGNKITTSGGSSLFQQFKGNEPLDYALFDIGDGKKWLTSRLFIFAIMLERMRGLRCLVFVETTSDVQQRFLGIASPSEIRWKLAMLNPWLEPALARASYFKQYSVYIPDVPAFPPSQSQYDALSKFVQNSKSKFPDFPPSQYAILSVNGALEPNAAESLVRAFLEDPDIHQSGEPSPKVDWEEVPQRYEKPFWEHANWIDREWIQKLDLKSGDTAYLKSSPDDSQTKQTQALLWRKGSAFIALVDNEKRFVEPVDRHTLLEKVVENLRKALDDTTEAKR
jgi:hypothetical protein